MQLRSSMFAFWAVLLWTGNYAAVRAETIEAQSGLPGDGIPDIYYTPVPIQFPDVSQWGIMGGASFPAGSVWVNTDGHEMIAVFVSGPDVSQVGCLLCDGMELPQDDGFSSIGSYTVGYANDSTQWLRTNPLNGGGFLGVTGYRFIDGYNQVQPWPDDVYVNGSLIFDFPDAGEGLANYGPNLDSSDFPLLFGQGSAQWQVTFVSDSGTTFLTDISIVPEPTSATCVIAWLVFSVTKGRARSMKR